MLVLTVASMILDLRMFVALKHGLLITYRSTQGAISKPSHKGPSAQSNKAKQGRAPKVVFDDGLNQRNSPMKPLKITIQNNLAQMPVLVCVPLHANDLLCCTSHWLVCSGVNLLHEMPLLQPAPVLAGIIICHYDENNADTLPLSSQ